MPQYAFPVNQHGGGMFCCCHPFYGNLCLIFDIYSYCYYDFVCLCRQCRSFLL